MSAAIWVGYPRSYTPGRVRAPQFVVCHYTAGSEGPTSAESGAQYDKNRTDGTSTHYFVDSSGPALQEVPEGDRAHCALFHGNEIGIHIEICGTRQTREQWLDAVSYPTVVMAARLTREICDRQGFALKLLTVAETRNAYYGKDFRPTGITDHGRVTQAFPEDGGDHMDVGDEFPWDVFMDLVVNGTEASDMDVEQDRRLYNLDRLNTALLNDTEDVTQVDPGGGAAKITLPLQIVRRQKEILAKLDSPTPVEVDAEAVAAALAADVEFLQAIADKVADTMAGRLTN